MPPQLSSPVLKFFLVHPNVFLAIIFNECWHPIEYPGNSPIWFSVKNYQRSELIPIQSKPKEYSALHWSTCCLQEHYHVTLISKCWSAFHVKENINLINVNHILPAVLTLGQLVGDVGYKVLDCHLTMASFLWCIGDMVVVSNTHTCKPARCMLNHNKEWYWCIRKLVQFQSEHNHRNMSTGTTQHVKFVPNGSIVININVYLATVKGLLCLAFQWSEYGQPMLVFFLIQTR